MTHEDAVRTLATERYLLDDMTEDERDAFEAHYFECRECADDVLAASRMRDGAAADLLDRARRPPLRLASSKAPADAGPPAPARPARPWYRTAGLPWAVAASLAVAVGYQSTSRRVPRGEAIAALTPTLLRPASRGTPPVATGAGGHLALALDVEAGGAAEVTYTLHAADGRAVLTGTADAPPPGLPLLLVVPALALTGEQRYSLSVRDARSPGTSLGEFTFIAGTAR